MISFPAPRLRELSLENFNFWARCIWPNAYLLTKAPYEQNTRDKFKALKELYIEQAGFSSDDNITDALRSIHQWRATYKDVISQLRQQSFLGKLLTRKSSTEAMADEIETEFTSIARRASSSLI